MFTTGKKYELLASDLRTPKGNRLYRIRALRDFGGIQTRTLGGLVEKEANLSHEGLAWVCDNARVFDDAFVCDDAQISERAWIHGCARIYGRARVYGKSYVFDNAMVSGNSRVYGKACVFGSAHTAGNSLIHEEAHVFQGVCVYENAQVFGNASVFGKSFLDGSSRVYGDAHVYGLLNLSGHTHITGPVAVTSDSDYLTIGPIGSRDGYTTFIRTPDDIFVACGCWNGNIQDFRLRVGRVHGLADHRKHYLAACSFAEEKLGCTA